MSEFPVHWSPMRPTLPAGTERGGRQCVQLESSLDFGGEVDSRIPAGLTRGRVDSNNDDNARQVRPARLAQAVSVGIQGGGAGDGSRSSLHAVDDGDDDFEADLPIRRVRAATDGRAPFRGSTSGVTGGVPLQSPSVVVECSDDDLRM